jgi:hypothetical protein
MKRPALGLNGDGTKKCGGKRKSVAPALAKHNSKFVLEMSFIIYLKRKFRLWAVRCYVSLTTVYILSIMISPCATHVYSNTQHHRIPPSTALYAFPSRYLLFSNRRFIKTPITFDMNCVAHCSKASEAPTLVSANAASQTLPEKGSGISSRISRMGLGGCNSTSKLSRVKPVTDAINHPT